MAREGSTLTPKLDLSIAKSVVMLGKSNFDGPRSSLERIFLVMPESRNISLLSALQLIGSWLFARSWSL